jgi:hypothetical protein
MKEEYDRFIDSLDVDSYEKIALSLKVFLIFSQSLKENDVLIESLLDLYDEEIYDKKIYNIFDSTYLYSEIFNKGSIRIKELVNIMKWRHENYENILNNPAAIKKDDLKDYIKSLNSLAKRYEKDKFIMKKIELYRDEIPSL